MKKTISAVLGLILLTLTGCGSKNDSHTDTSSVHNRDLFAMDTFMTMRAYGGSAEAALTEAEKRITGLESLLSVTDENSEIWELDHAHSAVLSEDTVNIIKAGLRYGSETDGALQMTVYPVVRAWGFTTGGYRIPESSEITSLLENVDDSRILLSEDGTASLPEGYEIDLGALAKGYTGDAIMDTLRENGVTSAVISLGGNVQTLGQKPDGSPWTVAVLDPASPDRNLCVLKVGEKAVITSGNYERYFTGEDGRSYWHIIDPADGCPADNGLVSVTIIGDSGVMCDALSTALFVKGTEGAQSYWRSHSDEFEMILVTDDNKLLYTPGLTDSLTNVSALPAEVIDVD